MFIFLWSLRDSVATLECSHLNQVLPIGSSLFRRVNMISAILIHLTSFHRKGNLLVSREVEILRLYRQALSLFFAVVWLLHINKICSRSFYFVIIFLLLGCCNVTVYTYDPRLLYCIKARRPSAI